MFEIIGLIILGIIGWIITTILLCYYILAPIIDITYRFESSLKNSFIEAFGFIMIVIIFLGNFVLWVIIIAKMLGEI